MGVTKKIKAEAFAAPQTRDDADSMIERIGQLRRKLQTIETDLNEQLASLKAAHEEAADPARTELGQLIQAVHAYFEANRERLTEGGRIKTCRLGAGEVSWRQRPPSVSLRKVKEVIAWCLARKGFERFLRIKHEVDKEAMLKEPAIAVTIPGVSIGSTGEDFVIKPFETELEEVA